MRTALITGINGQDGLYLAEFLLAKAYRVVGTDIRINEDLVHHLSGNIDVREIDLCDAGAIEDLMHEVRPDEVYNLAARASSRDLWTEPVLLSEVNGLSVTRLLEVISKTKPGIRFVQASSSEIFGDASESPQDENTPLSPRNPYGVAKAYAHCMVGIYRKYRGVFAGSAILYNHESPRRGLEFVTRKISLAAARISAGEVKELRLGRLDDRRDWGFAGDYVEAMWLMSQQSEPDDYVISSGECHSVREFCEIAFSHLGLNYEQYVVEDSNSGRAVDTVRLLGNRGKAIRKLGWKPRVNFCDLVCMMVNADVAVVRSGQRAAGYIST